MRYRYYWQNLSHIERMGVFMIKCRPRGHDERNQLAQHLRESRHGEKTKEECKKEEAGV